MKVIIADGIETLPQENWPPKEALMKLLMIRVKTSQTPDTMEQKCCKAQHLAAYHCRPNRY